MNLKNLTVSQKYLPGFLIKQFEVQELWSNSKKSYLQIILKFEQFLGVQFFIFYIPTIVFSLISYSNFFIPIISLTGRFLIISIPLVAILIIYQQVPEFAQWTFIDYWFSFIFFYILSMFGVFLISLKEFISEQFVANQYQQVLMNLQTDKSTKEMAFSNWKAHLKQQAEEQNSSLVSVSNLKTDHTARTVYPIILIAFLIFYVLFLISLIKI